MKIALKIIFLLLLYVACFASHLPTIELSLANHFGTIALQGSDGRIKPIDTISNDLLRKVYRKDSFENLNPNQVILGMITHPQIWKREPMILVSHIELKNILGIEGKYASYWDFFENNIDGAYKLEKYVELANRKKPAGRNQFDKDVLKVDERVNICYMVYGLHIFRVFPLADMWMTPSMTKNHSIGKNNFSDIWAGYIDALKANNYFLANTSVEQIKALQEKSQLLPSSTKIKAEILFNKLNIFAKLSPLYMLSGFLLLIFIFLKLIFFKLEIKMVVYLVYLINICGFIAHTIGTAMRWYIAGHAPWSNSYEAMVYIAWALVLSGMIFSRRSLISLSLTSILAGITLFAAHLSWMDPQITNLVPVLKSYWLIIHVCVIVASYGFLGLSALLGIFTLILMGLKTTPHITSSINEATKINEMSMILGLSLLIVGNFLGGVWANESWGRYWGWDPKESWTLITVLVYAIIVHIRFIPKLNNDFTFALLSMFAYWSVIMTYFGVNFYLSGLHSYASSEPMSIPNFVWVILTCKTLLVFGTLLKSTLEQKLAYRF